MSYNTSSAQIDFLRYIPSHNSEKYDSYTVDASIFIHIHIHMHADYERY